MQLKSAGLPLLVLAVVALAATAERAEAARCKEYRSCSAAVKAWCAGRHPGADRDKDKIPCENVCKSLKQSRKEARKLGCKKAG